MWRMMEMSLIERWARLLLGVVWLVVTIVLVLLIGVPLYVWMRLGGMGLYRTGGPGRGGRGVGGGRMSPARRF